MLDSNSVYEFNKSILSISKPLISCLILALFDTHPLMYLDGTTAHTRSYIIVLYIFQMTNGTPIIHQSALGERFPDRQDTYPKP